MGFVKIKFVKPTKYIKEVHVATLKTGNIKNPYHKSIFGWGCIGENPAIPPTIKGKITTCYASYSKMVSRCKNKNDSRYNTYGGVGITISEEWNTYSAYSYWFKDNYIEGYHLDKDILQQDIPPNKKIYSPKTCMFIEGFENSKESANRRFSYINIKYY